MKSSTLHTVLLIFALMKAAILLILALNTRLVMDEFIHFGQSLYLPMMYDEAWPGKTVGYAIFFSLSHFIGEDAVETLLLGRAQAAILTLCTVGLIYLIARRLGHDRTRALLVIVVLLCFSTFIERGFRLRSETVALFFATAALFTLVHPAHENARRVFVAGLFCGLAFACTQKSIYFNFALGAGLVTARLADRAPARAVRDGAILIAGWATIIVAYCLAFGGRDALAVAHDVFIGPKFVALQAHSFYPYIGAFIEQTLERNLALYAACALGLLIGVWRFRSMSGPERLTLVYTIVLTILVFRHNQPWPYVFIMAIPFLSLWVPGLLIVAGPHRYGRILMSALLSAACALSLVRNVGYLTHSNAAQFDVIAQAEALLGPEQAYFDGVGMVPTRPDRPRAWLDAHAVYTTLQEGEDSKLMRALQRTPPDLVIHNYRIDRLQELLGPYLERSYVRVAPNILLPGVRLNAGSAMVFDVPVAGRYDLYVSGKRHAEASLIIDGKDVSFPAELERGPTRIEVPADLPEALHLLPAGLTSLPTDAGENIPLFNGVYTE